MNRFLTAHVSALALVLLAGTATRASIIPPGSVQWSYNFNPGAPAVFGDGNPSAGVTFTNEPTKSAVGDSDIVASNLRVFSSALASAPDMLSSNGAYSLTLQLTTSTNGPLATTNVTFTGKLTGPFSSENTSVANMFGPNSTQTVLLNGYFFKVSLIAYTPPGPPDQVNAGSIAAHVSITENVDPAEGQTPEPGTMLLSGLGLTFLGGFAWRNKRRQARIVAA
jgi:hypothetical protein